MSIKRSRPEIGVGGNWACPSCENVNFGTRTECNVCKTQPDGNWLCQACSNLNFPHRDRCNRCEGARPAGKNMHAYGPMAGGMAGGYGQAQMGMNGGMGNGGYAGAAGGYGAAVPAGNPYGAQAGTYGQPAGAYGAQQQAGYGAQQAAGYGAQQPAGYGAQPGFASPAGLVMQLVALFQGNPDPYSAAAMFVAGLGGGNYQPQKRMATASAKGTAPRAGDRGNWGCVCGNINFAFRDECNKCKVTKAEGETQAA